MSETNFTTIFEPIFQLALDDENEKARQVAVRALWASEDPKLIPTLLNMLQNDPSEIVRAQAAGTLGMFVYEGEIEEIPEEQSILIVDTLLAIMNDKENAPTIRRQALGSLGFSSHANVPAMIEEAFNYGDEDWLASALLAMSRSHDKQWHPHVIEQLNHPNNDVRQEAIRATGKLDIQDAVLTLIEMLIDPEDEIRMAVVWALSELGDEEGGAALENLLDITEDEEEIALIEEAIENLAFNSEMAEFDLFDFSEDDLEDLLPDSPQPEE